MHTVGSTRQKLKGLQSRRSYSTALLYYRAVKYCKSYIAPSIMPETTGPRPTHTGTTTSTTSISATPHKNSKAAIESVRKGVIGRKSTVVGPFGARRLVYCDYTASGRQLAAIEEFMGEVAGPFYANTHTEQSHCGQATTGFVEQARRVVSQSVRADPETHAVVFCGSGATAAVDKIIRVLMPQITKYVKDASKRPIVLVGPYEHHSNEVMWRETGAEVIAVPENPTTGNLEPEDVERFSLLYCDRPIKIASFSAGSNVTGICPDMETLTAVVKAHGFLSFWDCAAAGPYLEISIGQADGLFFSPHKFIGGPGSAGVLVARRDVFTNEVPTVPGGGTVVFVNHTAHSYKAHVEEREEGGTPGILQAIRTGLVFQLKETVGAAAIHQSEMAHVTHALSRLAAHPHIELLGSDRAAYHSTVRLPIISFRIRMPGLDGLYLHHGLVVALINDLYGIQARAGCFCAGPYMHRLLSYPDTHTKILTDPPLLKAGATRISLNYFMTEADAQFIVSAVLQVATSGWKLLPLYAPEISTGLYRYRGPTNKSENPPELPRLDELTLDKRIRGRKLGKNSAEGGLKRRKCLQAAERILNNAPEMVGTAVRNGRVVDYMEGGYPANENNHIREYRWFVIGSEAAKLMMNPPAPTQNSGVVSSVMKKISMFRTPQVAAKNSARGNISTSKVVAENSKEKAVKEEWGTRDVPLPISQVIAIGN